MSLKGSTFRKYVCIVPGFVICLFFTLLSITHANIESREPNILININGYGDSTCSGNLFSNDLWYPGKNEKGIIRISSDIGVKITRIGLDIRITSHKPEYDIETVYESFKNNMKLTIDKNKLLIFSNTLLREEALPELVTDNGYALDSFDQFSIGKGKSTDLFYTLSMDKDTSDELESVSAVVSFKINIEQN